MSADLIARLEGLTGPVPDAFERASLAKLAPDIINDLDSENLFNLALMGGLPAIGAAVALVERCLPGWRHAYEKRASGTVLAWVSEEDDAPSIPSPGSTPAIATLLALFRALEGDTR